MIVQDFVQKRELKRVNLKSDLVVVGGGITGVCAAITAARQGSKVILVNDRPVLGGNASSEIRLWVLGATSHMGNNNRWSREGGILDELLLENLYRNKEGNPVLFDTVILDKVLAERNISLLLNTVAYEVEKSSANRISSIKAINPQNATCYTLSGGYFADCTGDGTIAYIAGASFRMGAEDETVYGEKFCPDKESYGELLGHSIFFYTKETGNPVRYIAPDFALKEVEALIPRVKNPNYLNPNHHGCKYWWLEYGGRIDTVHDTEQIKMELWKVVYGVWDYLKNSGKFPETANQTLEWVGLIPGKRESRRFCGFYTLIQQDIIEQRKHYDDVAYGGWSIDLHPSDAVYSPLNGCNQWHSKGVYGIPYRCYLTPDVENLFLGGRMISASHVAHGSSRVMSTCSLGGNAIGMAASLCVKQNVEPTYYLKKEHIGELQQALINTGQYIPQFDLRDPKNKALSAIFEPSSTLLLDRFGFSAGFHPLTDSMALLFPANGAVPCIAFNVRTQTDTSLSVELRASLEPRNFTPEHTLARIQFDLTPGTHTLQASFHLSVDRPRYLFLTLLKNPDMEVEMSHLTVSGLMTVYNTQNIAVSNYGKQLPPKGIGVDEFEFWCPKRWPHHRLLQCTITPPLDAFGSENLRNSFYRPVIGVNGWVAAIEEKEPQLTVRWNTVQILSGITLFFDGDSDQALENAQMGHHFHEVPQCVREFSIYDQTGQCLYRETNNRWSMVNVVFDHPVHTTLLLLRFRQKSPDCPVCLMGIICT